MANEEKWDCNLCIHMNVCPGYMVTQLHCEHYLPQGNVIPVLRCLDCEHTKRNHFDIFGRDYCDRWRTEVSGDGFCNFGRKRCRDAD